MAIESYNVGEVTAAGSYAAGATSGVGGLFGTVKSADILQSFNTGAVTAPAEGAARGAWQAARITAFFSKAATAPPRWRAKRRPRCTMKNRASKKT